MTRPATDVFDAAWALYRADPLLCVLGIDPGERAGALPLIAAQLDEEEAALVARHGKRLTGILDALRANHSSLTRAEGLSVLGRCDALHQATANATSSDAPILAARFPEFSSGIIDDAIRRAMVANR